MDEAKMTANKEAKKIIVKSIQRVASETAIENSVTVFHIESDEIKGGLSDVKDEISGHLRLPPELKLSLMIPLKQLCSQHLIR